MEIKELINLCYEYSKNDLIIKRKKEIEVKLEKIGINFNM